MGWRVKKYITGRVQKGYNKKLTETILDFVSLEHKKIIDINQTTKFSFQPSSENTLHPVLHQTTSIICISELAKIT